MEADQKSAIVLVNNLHHHVQYLAADSLEGRRTGSKGETIAMNQISDQYALNGIEAKGIKGYIQNFEIKQWYIQNFEKQWYIQNFDKNNGISKILKKQ